MTERVTARGRLALVGLLALTYAGCYAAIKAGLAFAPPLRFAGLRALLAGVALLVVVALRERALLPPRRLWGVVLVVAAVGTSIAYGAMFLSPGRTGAGIASVLGNTTPLMAIALAAALLGEPVTRDKAVALVLGFAGVALIAYPALAGPAAYGAAGLALPLVAAAGSATESVVIKRAEVGGAFVRVAAWQYLLGSLPLFALSAWLEPGRPIVWGSRFVLLLAFVALVGTAFATALWYWLLQRDEVGRLALLLFLVPVFGLALAIALFGERLGARVVLGVLVALGGTAIASRGPRGAPRRGAGAPATVRSSIDRRPRGPW